MKIVGVSAGVGIAIGLAGVWGLPETAEGVTWVVVMLGMAVLIGASRRPFLSGLGSGMAMSIAAALMHAGFFATYLANQPAFARSVEQGELPMDARAFLLVSALPIGLVSGLALGALSHGVARLRSRRSVQVAGGPA